MTKYKPLHRIVRDNLPTIKEQPFTPTNQPCRILLLPVELQVRIFVLAQSPLFPTVCKQFYNLGQSINVRAQYLLHRYGPSAVLGKRSMKRHIVTQGVVEHLLKLKCCDARANEYWLFCYACELNQLDLCNWIIDAALEQLPDLMHIAARKGMIAVIDLLVEKYKVDIHQQQETVLALACRENRVATVHHLMTKYGFDVHTHNELHLRNASLHGHTQLVQLLLDSGSDIHAYNDAALQNAAYKGHSAIVKLLLDAGATAETNQNACIQYAITNNDLQSVQYLIQAGINPRCHHDWPLRHACRKGLDNIVSYLIHTLPIANVVDMRDGMPIEECIKHGKQSTLELLLKHGADPNSAGVTRGLDQCKHKGVMIKALLEAGLNNNTLAVMPSFSEGVLSWI